MTWPLPMDYQEAMQNPKNRFAESDLRQGIPVKNRHGLPIGVTGNFAIVFQMDCHRSKYAVRCFLRDIPDQEQRYITISDYLQKVCLPCMVDFRYVRKGIMIRGAWYPILKMEWVDGDEMRTYVRRNLSNPKAVEDLAQKFYHMMCELERSSIAHGDLQHRNIMVSVSNELRLVDCDGTYVPGLNGKMSNEIGHRNYQHPIRTRRDFGAHIDNFSAWIIYISLVALSIELSLWSHHDIDEEYLLFKRGDFRSPSSSKVLHSLSKIRNHEIQEFVKRFGSFISCNDLSRIPPLSQIHRPVTCPIHIPVSPRTGRAAVKPPWVQNHVPKKSVITGATGKPANPKPAWWIGHDQTQLARQQTHLNTPRTEKHGKTGRRYFYVLCIVVFFLITGMMLLAPNTIAICALAIADQLVLMIMGVCLYRRMRRRNATHHGKRANRRTGI